MKYILVDLSYVAHHALFCIREPYSDNFKQLLILECMESLLNISNEPRIGTSNFIICVDSTHSVRREAYPSYKHKRKVAKARLSDDDKHKRKAMYEIIALLTKYLPKLGFSLLEQKGLEADDVMAQASKQILENNDTGLMVLADADLFQSINSNVDWCDIYRSKYHTIHTLYAEYHVTPLQWGLVKAIGGCLSDNVPGISRVGQKGAIDYITGKLKTTSAKYIRLACAEIQEEIKFWGSITILPHQNTKPVILKSPTYSHKNFMKFFSKCDLLEYYKSNINSWKKFITGKSTTIRLRTRKSDEK